MDSGKALVPLRQQPALELIPEHDLCMVEATAFSATVHGFSDESGARNGGGSVSGSDTVRHRAFTLEQVPTDVVLIRRQVREQPPRGPDFELLRKSVRKYGILQPLLVRRENNQLQLISGHRRLEAAKIVGLPEVPCQVYVGGEPFSDTEIIRLQLAENEAREDLNPLDKAKAYLAVVEKERSRSREDIEAALHVSWDTFSRHRSLLDLSKEIQEQVQAGKLSIQRALAAGRSNPGRPRAKRKRSPKRSGHVGKTAEELTVIPGLTWRDDHATELVFQVRAPSTAIPDRKALVEAVRRYADWVEKEGASRARPNGV